MTRSSGGDAPSTDSTADEPSASTPTARGTTVLCVDDDPLVVAYLDELLRRSDAVDTVRTETRVAEATEWLSAVDADGGTVDCIVSDYRMPTDGLTFLRSVRETFPAVPFIVFTGTERERIEGPALEAGAAAVIAKFPLRSQVDVLVRLVEATLRVGDEGVGT